MTLNGNAYPVALAIGVNIAILALSHVLLSLGGTAAMGRSLFVVTLIANLVIAKLCKDRNSLVALCLTMGYLTVILTGFIALGKSRPADAAMSGIHLLLGTF